MSNIPISMHNTYTIYKVKNGIKEKIAHFHNLVVDQLYSYMAQAGSDFIELHSAWFGTGTTEPQVTDTALTKPLWTTGWNYSNCIAQYKPDVAEDSSFNIKATCKIPATADYVGEVSEVGLYFTRNRSYLFMGTKALIKDAEGNPISIIKTDTEELLIDIHIKILLGASGAFEWNPLWAPICISESIASPGSYVWATAMPNFGVSIIRALPAYPDKLGCRQIASVIPIVTYNTNTKELVFSKGRFTADTIASQRYINAIGLTVAHSYSNYEYYMPAYLSGWWKFPNADIFPQRTLSGMPVGTGDGSTTEFKPPLNMWVKDTERLYVNGIQLTRDVDYTCDHRNNLDNLLELRPTAFCKLLNELMYVNSGTRIDRLGFHPFNCGGNTYNGNASDDACYTYVLWDKDNPLIWELLEDPQVGLEADYFQMQSLYGCKDFNSTYNLYNAVFTLSYSNDLQSWTDAGEYTVTNSNGYASHKFEFEQTIRAKYWKLSINVDNCSDNVKASKVIMQSYSNPCYLGRYGSPIVFTNPPADGAIITMDADIDRPMKNSNFILDCNPTFQF